MKKLIIFLFLVFLYSSCTKIVMYNYGVRNPKIENSESITQYLHKNDLSSNNVYCLKDTNELSVFFDSQIGIPEVVFFDKNGFLMKYRDEKRCNAQNDSLISFLNPKNIVEVDSSYNLFDYLDALRSLDGEVVNVSEFRGFDNYLIIYWAKWLGKMNSVKLADWEGTIKNKTDLRLKTIKVTTDYMNFWTIDKSKMIKVYSPKTKTSPIKRH